MRDFFGQPVAPAGGFRVADAGIAVPQERLGAIASREAAKGVDAALDVIPPQRFLGVTARAFGDRLEVDCDFDAFFTQRCGRFARPRIRLSIEPAALACEDVGRRLRIGVEAALRRRRLAAPASGPIGRVETWIDRQGGFGAALPRIFLRGNWASDRLLLLLAISTERHGCRRCAEFVGEMTEMALLGDRDARRRLMMAMARKIPMIEDRLARIAAQSAQAARTRNRAH